MVEKAVQKQSAVTNRERAPAAKGTGAHKKDAFEIAADEAARMLDNFVRVRAEHEARVARNQQSPDVPLNRDEKAAEWLDGLNRSPAGEALLQHLTHVDSASAAQDVPYESSLDQCCTFRRAFIAAWGADSRAFNLPRKTPTFILLVNMSGERRMMYTDEPLAVKLLAHVPNSAAALAGKCDSNVNKLIEYVRSSKGKVSLLMCLSLPFHAGIDSLHWEMRTIRRAEGHVIDGELAYRAGGDRCRAAGQTSANESADSAPLLSVWAAEMLNTMQAYDLDLPPGVDITPENSGTPEARRLHQYCAKLTKEQFRKEADHKLEMEKLCKERDSALERVKELESVASMQDVAERHRMNEENKELQARVKKYEGVTEALKSSITSLKSELASEALCREEDMKEHATLRMKHSDAIEAMRQELAAANARYVTADSARLSLARAHTETVDGMEAKYSTAVMDTRKACKEATETLERMHDLSTALSVRDEQAELYKRDIEHLTTRIRVLKCIVALAASRYKGLLDEQIEALEVKHALTTRTDELNATVRELEAAQSAQSRELTSMRKETKARTQQHTKLEHKILQYERQQTGAAQRTARDTATIKELKKELAALQKAQPQTPETEDFTTQTDMTKTDDLNDSLKNSIKFGELCTEITSWQDKHKDIAERNEKLSASLLESASKLNTMKESEASLQNAVAEAKERADTAEESTRTAQTHVDKMTAELTRLRRKERRQPTLPDGHTEPEHNESANGSYALETVISRTQEDINVLARMARNAERFKHIADNADAQLRGALEIARQNMGPPMAVFGQPVNQGGGGYIHLSGPGGQ